MPGFGILNTTEFILTKMTNHRTCIINCKSHKSCFLLKHTTEDLILQFMQIVMKSSV